MLAAAAVTGCGRSDNADRWGDTGVITPVSVDSVEEIAKTCGVSAKPVIENDGIGDLKVKRRVSEIRDLCDVTQKLPE